MKILIMYIRAGIWFLLLFMTVNAQARIYKWTDAAGQLHFSDRPAEHAQELYTGETPNPDDTTQDANKTNDGLANVYTRFEVVQPRENQNFHPAKGEVVNVTLVLEPNLKPSHEIQFMLDGGLVPGRFVSTQLTINPVPNGTHKLYAIVVDATGKAQITSKTVTFNVIQESTP